MPYKTKGKCVYKKDTNKKVGCTKGDVDDYLAALHANENENIEEDEIIERKNMSLLNIYKRVLKEAKKKEDSEEKTPWSTGDRKAIKDYPLDLEKAEKKIKAAGSLEKLDKTFQEVLVLMDNGRDRDKLRATYKELRDKKKKNWKPTEDKVKKRNIKEGSYKTVSEIGNYEKNYPGTVYVHYIKTKYARYYKDLLAFLEENGFDISFGLSDYQSEHDQYTIADLINDFAKDRKIRLPFQLK